MIVGGGGGGGSGQDSVHYPSGGGGGEVKNFTNQTISAGTYTIVVGKGGTNASGTSSSAFGTTANRGGDGNVGQGGTSGSGNGPGANDEGGQYNVGGGGGDGASGSGRKGGDGSNVLWLDGTVYGEQVSGQAYFGGGAGSGNGGAHGKGRGLGTGGGAYSNTQLADSGIVVIRSGPASELPSLTFDGFNKYTFTGADTGSTYKLKYESNTYDLGTISNVYIAHPGTYSAEIKGATNFALSSNITGNLGTYLTLHDNVAISHTTGGGDTTVTVNNIKGNMTYKISFNNQWTDSNGAYSTRFGMKIKDSSDVYIRQINSFSEYSGNSLMLYDGGGSFDNTVLTASSQFTVSGDRVFLNGATPFTLADSFYVLLTMSTSDVITGKFFIGDIEVVTYFLTHRRSNTGTIGETGNKFDFIFPSTATISGVNMTVEEYNPAPKLDFDTYNKLTFSGLESGSTSNVTFDGNTYSIGTASNVYIENTGTYEAESKGTTTFALTKNVVTGSVTYKPSSTVDAGNFTLAFRHGSGTTDTSSNNCTLYSSLTAGEYDWGTVNSVSSTSTETTYNVTFGPMTNIEYLVLAGGGGGSNDYPGGGGGGGGMLDGTETNIPGNTYDIVVGDGGGTNTSGTDSSFHTFTAIGGGVGSVNTGGSGGSGGGGGRGNPGGTGVAGPPRQGYNGGTGDNSTYSSGAGGGGAGGVLEGSSITLPASTYTITVGGGGAGVTSLGDATPGDASNTTITYPGPYTWTANRGGHGAGYSTIAVQPGGSGGGGVTSGGATGGTSTQSPSPTPLGTLTGYGNAGGDAPGSYQGAGGGGAGAVGGAPPSPGVGGSGGIGRQLPATFRNPVSAPSDTTNPAPYQRGGGLGTPGPSGSYWVAGGGGGAAYPTDTPGNRGLGGAGGGGDGGYHSNTPPATDGVSALENTGSGGGGAGYSPSVKSTSGSGGSGIVLIAYPS